MTGSLLKADLQGVIPGSRCEQRQSRERPIELWIGPQEVQSRDLGVVVDGVWLIEDLRFRARIACWIDSGKHAPEWIIDDFIEIVGRGQTGISGINDRLLPRCG